MKDPQKISPLAWVPTLYFAMGLPFVVLNMVYSLIFKGMEVPDKTIAFWTGLVMLPWTLKPLWSPFLELYRTKKFFVVLTQLVSGVAFGLAAFALQLPSFFAVSIALLFVVAISGATHDIVADGVYMSELDGPTQARYIGWQGAFYNLAKLVATGGLVAFAGYLIEHFKKTMPAFDATRFAWIVILCIIAGVLLIIGLYHFFVLPSSAKSQPEKKRTASEVFHETVAVYADFFRKRHIVYYIAFIILYRFAEGFVMKIVPLFLKASRAEQGLGLDETQIGTLYGTFGSAAFVLGSILAGYYISSRGLKRSLFTLCCVFNFPFLAYTFLAHYQPTDMTYIGTAIVLEYFGYGFGFVGLTMFMMQQIAPGKHQMAHYAFASGIMNLGVMIPGMLSGYVCEWVGGYHNFFFLVLVAAIPALLITWFVPFTHPEKK